MVLQRGNLVSERENSCRTVAASDRRQSALVTQPAIIDCRYISANDFKLARGCVFGSYPVSWFIYDQTAHRGSRYDRQHQQTSQICTF